MITLLGRFPGLQVVDFRCREYLNELFANSGLHFDGSHHMSKQAEKFAATRVITTSMLDDGIIGIGIGGDQGITYKPWSCEESLRVLWRGIASATMRNDRP